jgi:hypothetical protein
MTVTYQPSHPNGSTEHEPGRRPGRPIRPLARFHGLPEEPA